VLQIINKDEKEPVDDMFKRIFLKTKIIPRKAINSNDMKQIEPKVIHQSINQNENQKKSMLSI
jgi:hypothetical protein